MGFALFRSKVDQNAARARLWTDWVQPGPSHKESHQHESGMKTTVHIRSEGGIYVNTISRSLVLARFVCNAGIPLFCEC